MDQLCKKFEDTVNKKNKGGMKVKAHQIKQHCWIFVNAQIENPSFDSQTKENMTLIKSKHGSKPELSDKEFGFYSRVGRKSSFICEKS